jgi:hypothetical protein
MVTPLCFFLTLLASPFKSKTRLEAENAALRHQLIVLQRKVRGCVHFTNSDRLSFIQLVSLVSVSPPVTLSIERMEWPTMARCFPRLGANRNFRPVRDATGQALAYLYARSTESEADEAKQLTFDEARRAKITRLPELLRE